MKLTVEIVESNSEFIAVCPELDINCYGSNRNEASRRIKNVIDFYIDSAKEMGLQLNKVDGINVIPDISSNTITPQKENTAVFYN